MSKIRAFTATYTNVSNAGEEKDIGYLNEQGAVVAVYISTSGSAVQMDDIQIRHLSGDSDAATLVYGSSNDLLPVRDSSFNAYFDSRTFGTSLFLYLKPNVTSTLEVTVLVEVY